MREGRREGDERGSPPLASCPNLVTDGCYLERWGSGVHECVTHPDLTAPCLSPSPQVVMWDLSGEHERIAAMRQGGGSKEAASEAGDEAHVPVVKWR